MQYHWFLIAQYYNGRMDLHYAVQKGNGTLNRLTACSNTVQLARGCVNYKSKNYKLY